MRKNLPSRELMNVCSQRLKSWQIHHFKWTNKTTQNEKKLQQITRKFLAKRDKSKFDIKYIAYKTWGETIFLSIPQRNQYNTL